MAGEAEADPGAAIRAADPTFQGQLEGAAGWGAQQRAAARIAEAFKAAYPEQQNIPPPARKATVPPGTDPHQLHRDVSFRERLHSGDWRQRDRAAQMLEAAYQQDNGRTPPLEPPARQDGTRYDNDGIPHDPTSYRTTSAVAEHPAMVTAVQGIASELRMTQASAIEFSRLIEQMAARELPGQDTLQAQSDGLGFSVSTEEFDRAAAAWATLERTNPALATVLEELGATTNLEVVRLLARTGRG